eukprot:m.389976 g.389976  ORF g.389976 m.389976 type:complete len:925 (+) comp56338_c0_seq5:10-2784(+)
MLSYALVFAVACACYLNTLNAAFVHDDIFAIKENIDVNTHASTWSSVFFNDFWGKHIRDVKSNKSYRPLTVLSFRLNHLLGGLNPWGYHAFNVILHGIVALLFARLAVVLFARRLSSVALVASLLFATHPIHVEAVANVVGRAELLSAMFFLLAFLKFHSILTSIGDRQRRLLTLTDTAVLALLTTCSCLAKEVGIMTLPFCGAFYVFAHLRLDFKQLLSVNGLQTLVAQGQPLLVLGALSVGLLWFRLWVNGFAAPVFLVEDNPASFADSLWTKVLSYSYLYAFNSWLLLVPKALCADWQMSSIPLLTTVSDARIAAVITFYAAFLMIARWALWDPVVSVQPTPASTKKDKTHSSQISPRASHQLPLTTAFLLAVITFLPASNLLFRVGFVVADRVLYIPSMGFCLLLACILRSVKRRASQSKSSFPHLVTLMTAVILALYASKTILRNEDWKSRESMNRSGLEVNPRCAKCHYNLGNYHKERHEFDLAAQHYKQVLELWPNHPSSHNNFGTILEAQGRLEEAVREYEAAIALNPSHGSAHVNLGNVFRSRKHFQAAIESYGKALAEKPMDLDIIQILADTHALAGQLEAAISLLRAGLTAHPRSSKANHLMATYLRKQHAMDPSIVRFFELAIQTAPPAESSSIEIDLLGHLAEQSEPDRTRQLMDSLLLRLTSLSEADLLSLGAQLRKLKAADQGKLVYQELFRRDANNLRAAIDQAKAIADFEGVTEADAFLKPKIKAIGSWDAFNKYAQFLIDHTRWSAALPAAKKAAVLYEQHAQGSAMAEVQDAKSMLVRLWRRVAEVQIQLGDSVGAEATFEQVLKLDSENAEANFALANILSNNAQDLARLRRAEPHFLAAIRHSDPSALYHGNLGALYHLLGEYQSAIKYYEAAIKLDPHHANAVSNLQKLRSSSKYKNSLRSV